MAMELSANFSDEVTDRWRSFREEEERVERDSIIAAQRLPENINYDILFCSMMIASTADSDYDTLMTSPALAPG